MTIDHREEYELASAAAARLRDEGFGDAVAAIQTGSGIPVPDLGGARSLTWTDIAGMPSATAPGHRGAVHHGTLAGAPVLVLEGRLHTYEGHCPAHVIRPVRAVGLAGAGCLILTNATGGVREGLAAGDLVRIVDHVNLMGVDPLAGPHDPRFGARFPVRHAARSSLRVPERQLDPLTVRQRPAPVSIGSVSTRPGSGGSTS